MFLTKTWENSKTSQLKCTGVIAGGLSVHVRTEHRTLCCYSHVGANSYLFQV